MAYRQFRNELTYDAPDIDLFPKTLSILQQAAQQRHRDQQQNKALAATYKADDLTSQFTTDSEKLNLLSADITNSAISDLRQYGYLTPETVQKQARAIGYKKASDAQWSRFQQAKEFIAKKKFAGPDQNKDYLDKDKEYAKLIHHVYGDHNAEHPDEVDWNNREKRLDDWYASQGKVDITSVNSGAFLEDFANQHKNSFQKTVIDPLTGNAHTESMSAPFIDSNGIKKVTLDNAKELINSSGDIADYYHQKADLELLDDARKMAGTKEGAYLSGLDPEAIVQLFRNEPSRNTQSKLTPAERELAIAKQDLELKQDQIVKNSVRFAPTKAKDKGRYSPGENENIVYSDTDFNGGKTANTGGVGQIILKKNGGQPTINIEGNEMIDLSNGKTRQLRPGSKAVNISGIQLVPTTRSGRLAPLKGNTTEEFIHQLDALPDGAFDPNNRNSISDLSIGIRGTYLDKGKTLSQAMEKQKTIHQELAQALRDNNPDEVTRLTKLQDNLEKLRDYTGRDELNDSEQIEYQALQSLLGLGDTQNDVLIKGMPQDMKTIKGLTQGYDPNDQNKWSPDMLKFKQAFEARKAKAAQNDFGRRKVDVTKLSPEQTKGYADFKQKTTPQKIAQPKSEEEYNKLPSGAQYLDENGKTRTKK